MDLVDNTAVRHAVHAFAAEPGPTRLYEVLRVCMYGDLLFDITGSDPPVDGAYPPGARMQIRAGNGPDGRSALFAFTSNAEIARVHPPGTPTQSMVTTAPGALEYARHHRAGWLYIDPAGPTCALADREIDFVLRNPRNEPLKTVLAQHHTEHADRDDVLRTLRQDGPLLLAVDDTDGSTKVAGQRMGDGTTALLGFTSAAEILAHNASDGVAALTTTQVIDMVLQSRYSGLVVDPSGPSIAVPRSVLAG
ncbi:SseB family protein [Mycolicibacterium smegmatis]|uniref:SseB protein N-terminal domain-containing protein n=3 Tax=Mycolicibacterium smegmatis TaxID=1772 RepID=I7FFW3_MYCS2|nr:SseB family protein [Mycolicibacterium smegmatis]ABK70505.1 hypothetical protein MSMEG_1314 [Mycolicibacterium smegmatis MC2 155]AFP37753.1 hypothetical protein MSMEI_1277 [Mycolicibacterium smegmatis MC2 155]AIU06557.1 hypothetical protein LJ00_06550 [Mycolicibacterium smegmatis MC2 155]AIU13182.1 hypothetical protein LI99_06550 [Mycolicibacterium smegmatis]AIU19806.1 hypothetical protein LI98_06550 [Mycolicibacterium smegmatis]